MNPGRLLVFVRPELDSGEILYVSGEEFLNEVHNAGWDISDHNFPTPTQKGLQIFEGWIQVGPGEDPDVAIVGEFRKLTHWEM